MLHIDNPICKYNMCKSHVVHNGRGGGGGGGGGTIYMKNSRLSDRVKFENEAECGKYEYSE